MHDPTGPASPSSSPHGIPPDRAEALAADAPGADEAVDAAVERPDRDRALEVALETNKPFTGLRDFTPDPKLFHYLPATLARTEQIVPLLLIGDALKVACARPDPDLDVINERFPALTVDIVIAPAAEIAAALERMQPEMPR
jgi:hypothetical protein